MLLLLGVAIPGPASAERPEIHYMLHCQGCHGPEGGPSIREESGVPALKDQVGSFLGVPGGREYLVRVPGSAQSPLTDAELAALLNWMIVRFGPAEIAGRFRPYAAAEVAEYRAAPLTDVEAVREQLLERIRAARP